MQLINQITNYVIILIIILIVIGLGFLAFFLVRKYRKTSMRVDNRNVDYSGLNRLDSRDFVKVDDIRDDMIITNNGTRFVAVIDCAGIPFYDFDKQEQLKISQNYQQFINLINAPIAYRMYCASSDLEDTRNRYETVLVDVIRQIQDVMFLLDGPNGARKGLSMAKTEEEIRYHSQMLSSLEQQLKVLDFRRIHLLDQINYIDSYSGKNVAPVLAQTYVFDWTTDKLDSADMLSKEEIFERAKTELAVIADSKIRALSSTGVKARRCTTDELIDMYRRHFQPISSEEFKSRNLQEIDFQTEVVSSESIQSLIDEIREERLASSLESIDSAFDDIFSDKGVGEVPEYE